MNELVTLQREVANLYEDEYGQAFADSVYRALAMLKPDTLRAVSRAIAEGNKLDDVVHDIFGLNPLAPEWHKSTFAPRVVRV